MSSRVDFGKEGLCDSVVKALSSLVDREDHAVCLSQLVIVKAYLLVGCDQCGKSHAGQAGE